MRYPCRYGVHVTARIGVRLGICVAYALRKSGTCDVLTIQTVVQQENDIITVITRVQEMQEVQEVRLSSYKKILVSPSKIKP